MVSRGTHQPGKAPMKSGGCREIPPISGSPEPILRPTLTVESSIFTESRGSTAPAAKIGSPFRNDSAKSGKIHVEKNHATNPRTFSYRPSVATLAVLGVDFWWENHEEKDRGWSPPNGVKNHEKSLNHQFWRKTH